MSSANSLENFFISDKKKIEERLLEHLDIPANRDNELIHAMEYSVIGGKMLRGIFVLETARMIGASEDIALSFAAAVECIQAYSLIHDDLPCMDNDDYRRGKPSCHRTYGEALALLAGDALLTMAFEIIGGVNINGASKAAYTLAHFAGRSGMVGGQVLDLKASESAVTAEEISLIREGKTAALFEASVALGAIAGNASDEDYGLITDFALAFGHYFQIKDDLADLDIKEELNSTVAVLGKEETMKELAHYKDSATQSLNMLKLKGFNTKAFYDILSAI